MFKKNGVTDSTFYSKKYIAPTNGWFSVFMFSSHNDPANIFINGVKITYHQYGSDGMSFYFYPVSKDDILTINPSGYMANNDYFPEHQRAEILFFPCKLSYH